METMERTNEEIRQQQRFARRAILFSTLALLVLTALLLAYLRFRPTMLMSAATKAMDDGQYARATWILAKLDDDADAEALLLVCKYRSAAAKLERGAYEDAKLLFAELGDYSDSRTMTQTCSYRQAETVYEVGDYATARDMFYALSGFSDSMTMYDSCRYHLAEQAYAGGDAIDALNRYLELDAFEDAREQAGRIAMEITGIADVEAALSEAQGLTPEEMERRARLTSVRETNPSQVLGTGFYHTVGLRADGTVVATGRDAEGQCDVSKWTDVVAVAAGAYHTVGLKADGTVVAVGRNTEGQCDVTEWSGVAAVACADYDTVALLLDGTVVSTGFHDYAMLSGWTDVVSIGAGSYIVVGARSNGQLVATHISAQDETLRDLVAVDASTGYAVGLCVNGKVLHTFLDLSDWSDVVCVEASSTGTFGLTADGRVLSAYFRQTDALDFSDIAGAVAISAGGTHVAVMRSDGTVVTLGENGAGQCDTASWNLS